MFSLEKISSDFFYNNLRDLFSDKEFQMFFPSLIDCIQDHSLSSSLETIHNEYKKSKFSTIIKSSPDPFLSNNDSSNWPQLEDPKHNYIGTTHKENLSFPTWTHNLNNRTLTEQWDALKQINSQKEICLGFKKKPKIKSKKK